VTELPPGAAPYAPDVIAARPVVCALPPDASQPRDLAALSRRDAALDLVLLLAVALLMPVGFELAAMLTLPETPELSFSNLIIIRKWFDALLLVVLAGYFIWRQRVPAAAFGLLRGRLAIQALWALPTLVAVYAAFLVVAVMVGALVLFYPELQQDLVRRTEFIGALPLNDTLATVLLLIPVAIHEELLFRGLLIPYLHRVGCSWGLAVLISTAVFAGLHGDQGWLGIIQVFGVGAVLGASFVLTRSLLAVMLAHFLFDFLQLQLARVVLPWVEQFAQQVGDG